MLSEKQRKVRAHTSTIMNILKEERVKRFAEIGVWKARSAKRMLKGLSVSDLEEYWTIDPWDINFAYTRTEKRRTEKDWFKMYWYCCRLMTYFPRLRVLRMVSRSAADMFPDGYFDMVFIDAIHTFHHVNADIGYWLPKVRKGGIIAGHDYGHKRYIGVTEAVNKWFGEDIEVWKRPQVWIKRL